MNNRYIIGIDTGGTFTDIVLTTRGGDIYTTKSPTTPHDFSLGVMNGIREMARMRGLSFKELLSSVDVVRHGTTVVTNALINRSGCKVGLITTKGFEGIPIIMRGGMGRTAALSEDELKNNVMAIKPKPLVPRPLIRGVSERIDCFGTIVVPLNRKEALESLKYLVEDQQVEALVVSFLFSFVNHAHEKTMKDLFNETYPGSDIYFSMTHELVPVIREYARTNTAIINAYVSKAAFKYMTSLQARLKEAGYQGHLLFLQGNGGTSLAEELNPISMEQSGPAGGVVAAKFMADLIGHKNVISSDSGGTSFDASVLGGGVWRYSREPIIERFHCILPLIDIQSIGSGGGTMAHVDPETKTLTVGPKSAGAHPGPVCYDQGGTQPTIVDANLVLGLLDPDYFLGGRVKLNKSKAEEAIRKNLASPLGMTVTEVAAGIYDIANAHMSDLIRKQIMPLGLEPNRYILYAYGGTGPVHAAAYAAELGIQKVYVFPTSPVFSALGAAIADVIVSDMISYQLPMPADPKVLNEKIEEMHLKLYDAMKRQGVEETEVEFRHIFYMRYRKQLNELPVDIPVKMRYDGKDIREVMEIFDQKYEETYGAGAAYKQAGMEVISIQMDAIRKSEKIKLRQFHEGDPDPSAAIKGNRKVCFAGGSREFVSTPIYDYGKLTAGHIIKGPGIIESPLNTGVIPPGCIGKIDKYLNIEITLANPV